MTDRSSTSLAAVRIAVPIAAAGVAALWIGTWLPGVLVFSAAVAVATASLVPVVTALVRARREAAEPRDADPALVDAWRPTITRARPGDVLVVLVGIAVVALVLGGQTWRPKCQCITTPCGCADGPSWAIAPP